jgi:hypothetical protein
MATLEINVPDYHLVFGNELVRLVVPPRDADTTDLQHQRARYHAIENLALNVAQSTMHGEQSYDHFVAGVIESRKKELLYLAYLLGHLPECPE